MTEFHDLRELDDDTLRDIVVQSGVIWPDGGDRESRLFRFKVRRIATEAFRRGYAARGRVDEAVATMFGDDNG